MANDVKFKLGMDTSEAIAAFDALIKKIQASANKLKLTPTASKAAIAPTTPGLQRFHETAQAARAQESKNKADQDALRITKSRLEDNARQLRMNNLDNERANNTEKEKNRIIAERNVLLKQQDNLVRQQKMLEKTTSGGGGGVGGGPGAAAAGGFSMPEGGITSLAGLAGALGVPVLAIGALATTIAGMAAGEGIRKFYAQAENRAKTESATAFNTQGQAGQLISSAFSGGGLENTMFGQQRSQAFAIARETQNANVNSPFRYVTHPQEMINYLGLGSNATREESENKRRTEEAEIQAQQEEAIKNGPLGKLRTEVANTYLKNWRRDLDFQRKMGMSQEGMLNYLGGVNSAGFQNEEGMGMSSAIQGAGGSTRAANGNATFALQMQRQFGLTNAGQAIGALSGQLGSSQMSKEALISIQAEGTRIGVNNSQFTEENRKFVEIASNVIGQSTATSSAGLDQILGTLSKFMGGPGTMASMEAGKTAYEIYQSQSKLQSGPTAVLRSAEMRKDTILGQLSERDRAKLSFLGQEGVNPDSQIVQDMASRYPNMSVSQIVSSYGEALGKSQFISPVTDAAVAKLRNAQQAVTGPIANGDLYGQQLTKLGLAEGNAAGEIGLEGNYSSASEKVRLQIARAAASGNRQDMAALQKQVKEDAESNKAVRPGDESNKMLAETYRMSNELFKQMQDDIITTAKQTAVFTANVNALVTAMKGGNAAAIDTAQRNLYNTSGTPLSPSTQTTAGSGGPPTTNVGDIRAWQNSQ